jgi:hypothetical protein
MLNCAGAKNPGPFLTLFRGCIGLDHSRSFPGFDLLAGTSYQFGESTGQFVNALRLSSFDALGRNQFHTYANRGSSRQNEICGGLLIHATGCYQRDVWQRKVPSANLAVAADLRTRKNFDEIGSSTPSRYHFRRGQRSGENRDVFLGGEFDDDWIERRCRDEARSRVHGNAAPFPYRGRCRRRRRVSGRNERGER